MKTLTSDFIGFSYNGIHSSDLGIIRVSDGSRFNENLLPPSQDKIAQVPGQDGAYFFGSQYTQQQFNISFAFDGLTEQQLVNLTRVLGDKKIHPLIFDERPYKTYMAKITGNTLIKYIPFSQGETNRIYKGEGSIQFTCYNVYAKCENKFWETYYNDIPNITEDDKEKKVLEWNYAANLLKNNTELENKIIDSFVQENDQFIMNLYNPGEKESPIFLEVRSKDDKFFEFEIQIEDKIFKLGGFTSKTSPINTNYNLSDNLITVNSKNKLIEGWIELDETDALGNKKRVRSGNIYNEYIKAGDFLFVPTTLSFSGGNFLKDTKTLYLSTENDIDNFSLNYYYYYF